MTAWSMGVMHSDGTADFEKNVSTYEIYQLNPVGKISRQNKTWLTWETTKSLIAIPILMCHLFFFFIIR